MKKVHIVFHLKTRHTEIKRSVNPGNKSFTLDKYFVKK